MLGDVARHAADEGAIAFGRHCAVACETEIAFGPRDSFRQMLDERFATLDRQVSRSSGGQALVGPTIVFARWGAHWTAWPQGTGFFFTSTLLPITPPRMAPAAPPITAPFTLSRLVAAPIAAPATPPMMASRFVFFSVTVRGADCTVLPLVLPVLLPLELPPDDERRVEVVRRAVLVEVRAGAGRTATGAGAAAAAAAVRSAALMESRRALLAWAARLRSAFSDGSAGLS